MSEIMLHGVLNMPPELWNNDSPIDVMQRHSRYVQASKYIDELETELAAVTEQRDKALEKIKNQAERIVYLEGATNHATGTPLSKAIEQRDRLAEALNNLWYNHSLTGSSYELIEQALQFINKPTQ